MNMMSSIESASNDSFAFEAALTREEWWAMEEVCQSFGVNRRIMIGLGTKNRAELSEALTQLNDEEDGLDKTLDIVADYREHVEQMLEFAKMVEARIIVSCHDVLGLSFDETCPK